MLRDLLLGHDIMDMKLCTYVYARISLPPFAMYVRLCVLGGDVREKRKTKREEEEARSTYVVFCGLKSLLYCETDVLDFLCCNNFGKSLIRFYTTPVNCL